MSVMEKVVATIVTKFALTTLEDSAAPVLLVLSLSTAHTVRVSKMLLSTECSVEYTVCKTRAIEQNCALFTEMKQLT